MDANKKIELKKLFDSKLNIVMKMYLETCARCGNCIDACHVYASRKDIKNSAVYRHEFIRKLYTYLYKVRGKAWPSINEALKLDDMDMEQLYEAAYSCTGCRRCMVNCPFGIDTQMIMSIAKLLLIGSGKEPQVLSMLADMSIAKGKMDDNTKANFEKGIKNLETEVIEKWKSEAGKEAIPMGVQDANILYVALAGKHSIIPAAAIMNAAKEKWSLSYFEAVNFGAFVGNPQKTKEIAERIINEAKRLNVKEVTICECGTAFRVMKYMMGKQPFKVTSFVEVMSLYLKDGKIKLDKNKHQGKFSYHDPCQMARNGGIYDEAREIISHLTDNFEELTPNKKHNWCCGGGGGAMAIHPKEYRAKNAKVKAEQIKATNPDILATACENCHGQLKDLNDYYKLDIKVEFLSSLVADSLI
ncbi:MAG: (Fe-S)-binding protein [Pseudomonadota bacterium]